MNDTLTHFSTEIAKKLATDQDALIRRCITGRIGDNWTIESIIPRLRWEQEKGCQGKMLLLDDEPLLVIWPPESTTKHEEASGAHFMEWTVKYQEMP